jgi:hypothetical protein
MYERVASTESSEHKLFLELNRLLEVERTKPCDAIIWLQGDRYDRADVVLDIYKKRFASKIVLSGNNVLIGIGVRPGEDNVSLYDMEKWLLEHGVPSEAIVMEPHSMNTRDQSLNVCEMAKKNSWNAITIVGSSPHYQARYYLTFLKGKQEKGWKGKIIPASIRLCLSQLPGGRDKTVGELMEEEYEKILAYKKKDHVASFDEGIQELNGKIVSLHV